MGELAGGEKVTAPETGDAQGRNLPHSVVANQKQRSNLPLFPLSPSPMPKSSPVTDDFSRFILDAIPSLVFLLEEDLRIVDCNIAAEQLLGENRKLIIQQRPGEALNCIHAAATEKGCGATAHCSDCVVRNSVNLALRGNSMTRRTSNMEVSFNGVKKEVFFLVTAVPTVHNGRNLVLLILEDVSEVAILQRMLPICAGCKQIRDDDDYWHEVENYLRTHFKLDFTHSLCPECAKKLYPECFLEEGHETETGKNTLTPGAPPR